MSELRGPVAIIFLLFTVSWLTMNSMKSMRNETELAKLISSVETLKNGAREQVDLEAAPDNLRRVAEARADVHRDIVLLTSDTNQLDIAANLIANLAQFGHHHSLMLTDGQSTCRYSLP